MSGMPMTAATHSGALTGAAWMSLGLLGGLWILYLALRVSPRCRARWPWRRSLLWSAGLIAAGAGVIGPLADRAVTDFRAHMLGHLAIGMLAPLGLVMAAPITLLLRALPPAKARWLVRQLERRGPRFVAHPVTAAALNVGGLWLLFTTRLVPLMDRHVWLAAAIDLHMLLAGYLFTAAIIGIDPIRWRPSHRMRAVVLILALSAHAMLAKYLYANPPTGVDPAQARAGGMVMYYGGDVIDAALITIFCWQWSRGARPRAAGASAGRHDGPTIRERSAPAS
jgi:putative membrane protein